jgi:hypothetical protein
MPTKTSRREFWNGEPERLPDGFKLTKAMGDHVLTPPDQWRMTNVKGDCVLTG